MAAARAGGGRIAPRRTPAEEAKDIIAQARERARAAAMGGRDALTMGYGDNLMAAVGALGGTGGWQGYRQRYNANLAREQAQDRYDAEHYRFSRGAGELAGTAAQFVALGPAGATAARLAGLGKAVKVAKRIEQVSPLIRREIAVLGGAGAAAGVGGQAVSDAARRRPGTVGDYLGAGLGGVVDVAASLKLGAGRGGMAGAGATSVLQDVLNGRVRSVDDGLRSIDDATRAATGGGVFGAVAGRAGRNYPRHMTSHQKGLLGEELSKVRTLVRGDSTLPLPKKERVRLNNGKAIIPDLKTKAGDYVESKFGPYARLTNNQLYAHRQGLPNFRIDHFLPDDLALAAGAPMSILGSHFSQDTEEDELYQRDSLRPVSRY